MRRPFATSRGLRRRCKLGASELGGDKGCVRAKDLPPAIVINLACRSDRWKQVRELLQSLNIKFERLEATNGEMEEIPASLVSKWWAHGPVQWDGLFDQWYDDGVDVVVHNAFCMVKISAGERGCAWSHVRAWLDWLGELNARPQKSCMPLMVFEDDVVTNTNCLKVVRSALHAVHSKPPDLLYLGWGHWAGWRRVVATCRGVDGLDPHCIMEAEYPCTSHAYIIWPAGVQKLLECLPVDAPFDHWLARACSERKVVSYCIVEGEFSEASMAGDGSPGSDPWGGVIRQHRQDKPDTQGIGVHPAEMMLYHMMQKQAPPAFQVELPVDPSRLRVLDLSQS